MHTQKNLTSNSCLLFDLKGGHYSQQLPVYRDFAERHRLIINANVHVCRVIVSVTEENA